MSGLLSLLQAVKQQGCQDFWQLFPAFGNHLVAEHAFQEQRGAGQVHSIDVPLTVRAIAGLLLGLLTLQLLGDEVIAQRWEELPEVLTSLLFDGLQPGKETTHE